MAKKIKMKKSLYTTLFEDYVSTGGYNGQRHKKTKEELEEDRLKLWDSIINQKKVEIKKNNGKSVLERNTLKISPYKMKDPITVDIQDVATGKVHKETINAPAEIIAVCQQIREAAERSPIFGILMKRFDKPIIWTLNSAVSTAASDGIRIAYNVVFAYQLLQLGKADFNAMKEIGKQPKGDGALLAIGKYWLYVYIHETYHELYRHQEQAERKKETANGKNHDMSNVAMDAEINRDIEAQFSIMKGCTEAAGGIMDPSFPIETWDEIFDEYYYNNKKMPKHEQPQSMDNSTTDDMVQQPSRTNIDDSDDSDSSNGSPQNDDNENPDNQQDTPQSGDGQQSDTDNASSDMNDEDAQSDDNTKSNDDSQNGNSSNSNDPSSPSTARESDEYSDAYNDELKKISEEMKNKNKDNSSNNSDNTIDLSEGEQEDLIEQIKDALANGADIEDLLDITGSSSTKLSQKTSDELMQKLAEQLPDELAELKNKVQQKIQEQTEGNMSEIERAAREQARKDIADAMKQMEEQAAMEQAEEVSSEESQEMEAGKGTSDIPTVKTSSRFGGQDLSTREILSEIAAQEGQPYTAAELTANVKNLNDTFIKENIDKLKSTNAALGQKVEDIANKLKDVTVIANWKSKLKTFLKNVSQGEIIRTQSRRVMSQTWRDDRYMPYKSIDTVKEFGAADLFYLIDNSGSMWGAGFGEGIFLQIFGEILGIEKACDIQNSALTYFSGDNVINPANIRLWNKKTSKSKVLDMIGQKSSDQSGGTDIGGNVIAVTNLKKPYYSAKGEKHTLLLVFTDGEDYAQYSQIATIPARLKRDILFCLINRKSTIVNQIENLQKISGVNIKNIIAICTDEYTKK